MAKDNLKCIRMEVTDEAIRDFKINKKDIIWLHNGEGYKKYALVPVNDDVYTAYMRLQWREAQKNARSKHCMVKSKKTGKLVRCEGGKKCESCEMRKEHQYRKDFGITILSYEGMLDDGVDVENPNAFEDDIINRKVIQEVIDYASKIKPEYGEILRIMYELGGEPTDTQIVERLMGKKSRKGFYLVKEAKEVAKNFLK